MQKLLLCGVFLGSVLATLAHPSHGGSAGQAKGGIISGKYIQTHPEEGHDLSVVEPELDYDYDLRKDTLWTPPPDYVPDEEEYYDYYEPEEDEGEPHDYIADKYYDELWSSDDDPDYIPDYIPDDDEYHGGQDDHQVIPDDDEYHGGQDDHQVIPDSDTDPDFIPSYEDNIDYGSSEEYDSSEYSSLEDDYYYYAGETDETRLEEILLSIALLEAERDGPDAFGNDQTEKIFQFLKQRIKSVKVANKLITYLKNKHKPQVPAEYVKSKRQTKSLGYYSQQTGQIQQSGQTQHIGQIQQPAHDRRLGQIDQVDQADVAEEGESHSHRRSHRWFGGDWVDSVVDVASDTFDTVKDVASDTIDTVHDVGSAVVDKVKDVGYTVAESIVDVYHRVRGKISEFRQTVRNFFAGFSIMVQRGADYFVQHLANGVNQVLEVEILSKLQQKLSEGNTQVSDLFTLLGLKTTSWAQTHHVQIDDGLITLPHPEHSGQQEAFPNFFQEQDVIVRMTKMVQEGIITQRDMDLLMQQKASPIQIDTHPMNLRSLFKTLRGH